MNTRLVFGGHGSAEAITSIERPRRRSGDPSALELADWPARIDLTGGLGVEIGTPVSRDRLFHKTVRFNSFARQTQGDEGDCRGGTDRRVHSEHELYHEDTYEALRP